MEKKCKYTVKDIERRIVSYSEKILEMSKECGEPHAFIMAGIKPAGGKGDYTSFGHSGGDRRGLEGLLAATLLAAPKDVRSHVLTAIAHDVGAEEFLSETFGGDMVDFHKKEETGNEKLS